MSAGTNGDAGGERERAKRHNRWLLVFAGALFVAVAIVLYPSIHVIRDDEAWGRSANSIRNITIGLQAYHDAYGHFPPVVIRAKDGTPLYSWRVALLPFVEDVMLYKEFHLDEPWDSPHNRTLLDKIPYAYRPLGSSDGRGLTRFQVFVGPGTMFERDKLTIADCTDGPANTLLVVEAAVPVPWTKPDDLRYNPALPLPGLGSGLTKGRKLLGWEIRRDSGFVAGFADGKARFIRSDTPEWMLRALITRNGGEALDPSMLE